MTKIVDRFFGYFIVEFVAVSRAPGVGVGGVSSVVASRCVVSCRVASRRSSSLLLLLLSRGLHGKPIYRFGGKNIF